MGGTRGGAVRDGVILSTNGAAAAQASEPGAPIPAHHKPVDAVGAVVRCRTEMAGLRADLHATRRAPIPSAQAKRMVREQIEQ